jgi:hypothetical protein
MNPRRTIPWIRDAEDPDIAPAPASLILTPRRRPPRAPQDKAPAPHRRHRLGTLVVLVAALAGGSYWWFTEQVHSANARVDPETEEALATPPPPPLYRSPKSRSAGPGSNSSMDILLIGHDKPRTQGPEQVRRDHVAPRRP